MPPVFGVLLVFDVSLGFGVSELEPLESSFLVFVISNPFAAVPFTSLSYPVSFSSFTS